MYKILLYVFIASSLIIGCTIKNNDSSSNLKGAHDGEPVKLQITSYSDHFELFAEYDPFIVGQNSNILSHFSFLSDFKAIEEGTITISLNIQGNIIKQTLEKPTRKGIYSFDIKPTKTGKGFLTFEISKGSLKEVITIQDISVFSNQDEVKKFERKNYISKTNTVTFTKEQSWKIDFATDYPKLEPFGKVIKTTAVVQPSFGNEMLVTASGSGVVNINFANFLEGNTVSKGQNLLHISSENLSENNNSIRYQEAKNNFEKAKADFIRGERLVKEKIISEKEFLNINNIYVNAKVTYEQLTKNYSTLGQTVKAPMSGFLKFINVKNGAFVNQGDPICTIAQDKNLFLVAELPQKYMMLLNNITTGNIKNIQDKKTYSLAQLNGKISAIGKAATQDNFLIPITIQIENRGGFVSGSFVELFLKSETNKSAVVIPNSAIVEEQGLFFVWVQIHPELFEKREIFIGNSDGLYTEVIKGLTEKERIVTKGAINIKLAQATGSLDAHSGHVH